MSSPRGARAPSLRPTPAALLLPLLLLLLIGRPGSNVAAAACVNDAGWRGSQAGVNAGQSCSSFSRYAPQRTKKNFCVKKGKHNEEYSACPLACKQAKLPNCCDNGKATGGLAKKRTCAGAPVDTSGDISCDPVGYTGVAGRCKCDTGFSGSVVYNDGKVAGCTASGPTPAGGTSTRRESIHPL